MKHSLLSSLLLGFLLICQASLASLAQAQLDAPEGTITFIFEPVDIPFTSQSISRGGITRRYQMSFLDDHYLIRTYTFFKLKRDTLTISTKRDQVEFVYRYRGISPFYYLFQKGDTVRIKHLDTYHPYAEILNRKASPLVTNYTYHAQQEMGIQDFPALLKHSYHFFFMPSSTAQTPEGRAEQVKADALPLIPIQLAGETAFLEELSASGTLAGIDLAYRKGNLQAHSFRAKRAMGGQRPKEQHTFIRTQLSHPRLDSLLYFESQWASVLIDSLVLQHAPWKKTRKSNVRDYHWILNRVLDEPAFPPVLKQYFVLSYLHTALKQASVEQTNALFARIQDSLPDPFVIDYLADKFGLKQTVISELKVTSPDGEPDSLQHILQSLKGKVVYIDFWASWCWPCLHAMPEARGLRQKMQGKDVVFMYVSVDEDQTAWEQTSERLGLDKLAHNYCIGNLKTSGFMEEMDIRTFPRYLIYDKEGELVYRAAPSPGDERIKRILEEVLEK